MRRWFGTTALIALVTIIGTTAEVVTEWSLARDLTWYACGFLVAARHWSAIRDVGA